ncbi:hypothetical protein [Mycetohabitans endofungorum]|uniref:hypothetical protein n=1 Tax=Mycetohabitans endofungorum TaxID=417203 RepID=UPI0026D39A93
MLAFNKALIERAMGAEMNLHLGAAFKRVRVGRKVVFLPITEFANGLRLECRFKPSLQLRVRRAGWPTACRVSAATTVFQRRVDSSLAHPTDNV